MFGGVGVGERDLLVRVAENHDPAVGQRIADCVAAAEPRGLLPDGRYCPLCELLAAADQHGLTVITVFGLRQQVGGGEFGPGVFVGQHQHLRRPRRQVHGDVGCAGQLFGFGDVAVAGTENLVDARNALRSVSHGGHGLRPAEGEDAVHAAEVGRIENFGCDPPVAAARRAEYHLAASGDPGRQGEHQHRREERGFAAGDIQPRAADRHGALYAPYARHRFDLDLRRELRPVEGFDVGFRLLQRGLQLRRYGLRGFRTPLARHFERFGDVPFDAADDSAQGRVAARAHLGEDRGDALPDLLLLPRTAGRQRGPFAARGIYIDFRHFHFSGRF